MVGDDNKYLKSTHSTLLYCLYTSSTSALLSTLVGSVVMNAEASIAMAWSRTLVSARSLSRLLRWSCSDQSVGCWCQLLCMLKRNSPLES